MRKFVIFLAVFAASHAWAENAIPMPDYNSEKTCEGTFGPKGTRPNKALLRICANSEQKSYNLARTAWDLLNEESAQFCRERVKQATRRASLIRKYGYPDLVDPYTELWLCVNKRLEIEETRLPPKPFQKW